MPLVIISRRVITFRESGRGEVTVLMVPGRDQIQVVKDMAGTNSAANTLAAREAAKASPDGLRKQVQLSRVHIGRRFIYGSLPTEISDLRQPVKVWLAEDYAPVQSQAFFYIFSNNVVIHGVREQDDEGFQNWRTAQLALDSTDPLKSIINAISDYALANSVESLTVAVQSKLDLYEQLQAGLATYNISPVPFTKLKPQPSLKPLYKHSDFTILYLTLALFGFITLLASATYAMLAYMQRNSLKSEAAEIQSRIDSIKFNQSVGQITDPRAVLQTMTRAINQQPSAIIHAAGASAAELGDLKSIKVLFDGASDGQSVPPPAGQINVLASVVNMKDDLLVDQEQRAEGVLSQRPWVREMWRGGAVGETGDMTVSLQIDDTNLPKPAPTEPQPEAQPAAVTTPEVPQAVEAATSTQPVTTPSGTEVAPSVSATAPATASTTQVSVPVVAVQGGLAPAAPTSPSQSQKEAAQ
ncbi:MAG: hypothetical protein DI585_02270 [Pseudomonas fluorescens]|nr:MAG: hypothetical protein DI585_02270 [Pseudomonas fluorescens]